MSTVFVLHCRINIGGNDEWFKFWDNRPVIYRFRSSFLLYETISFRRSDSAENVLRLVSTASISTFSILDTSDWFYLGRDNAIPFKFFLIVRSGENYFVPSFMYFGLCFTEEALPSPYLSLEYLRNGK